MPPLSDEQRKRVEGFVEACDLYHGPLGTGLGYVTSEQADALTALLLAHDEAVKRVAELEANLTHSNPEQFPPETSL